jgi:hypothetical protein
MTVPNLHSESAVTWRKLLTRISKNSVCALPAVRTRLGIFAAATGMMLLFDFSGRPLNEVEHATRIVDRKEQRIRIERRTDESVISPRVGARCPKRIVPRPFVRSFRWTWGSCSRLSAVNLLNGAGRAMRRRLFVTA